MKEIDEKELVKKIINKDEKAFLFFYKKYQPIINNYLSKKISSPTAVEEICQDIFISFLEGLRDFHFQCSLKTFLFTIARNKVVDYYRKNKIKKVFFSHLPKFLVEQVSSIFIDQELERKEVEKKIKRIFSFLPKEYRRILRLKYIEEKKVKQIAKIFKISFKATESLLYRARKSFIKFYQQEI